VFYEFEGLKMLYFAWGLGYSFNNQAEALAVYMRLKLIGEEQNKDHVVVEESKLVINGPQFVHKCKNLSLMRNYQRIKQEGEKLQFIKYCHVLRHLNTKADSLAKEDQSI
jgi:ribonuclease HI